MTKKQQEQADAVAVLKKTIQPSDTIGIAIKSVYSSGMYRRMRVYTKDFQDISYHVAMACELPINDKGIGVSGVGMDMTFWLADTLTWHLYGKTKPKGLKGNGGGCINWSIL